MSDEMADASVESLKTWVQDVIVDSKVCPFTRSAEVAATGLENQGVEKGPILARSCGAVGSGGAALVRVLRAFWGSSIDMLSQPPSQASTVLAQRTSICGTGPRRLRRNDTSSREDPEAHRRRSTSYH